MSNDQEIILLALQFENDRLQSNSKIVIRLCNVSCFLSCHIKPAVVNILPHEDTDGDTDPVRAWRPHPGTLL